MGSRPDRGEALRSAARIVLILAVAAFGAVLVRNITDVLRGIAGHPQAVALQAQVATPTR